jgi:hypothetical protein
MEYETVQLADGSIRYALPGDGSFRELFVSVADLQAKLDRDKRNAEFRAAQAARQAAEDEAARLETAKLESFLSQFKPLQAGKFRKAMTASMRINGVIALRYKHAERLSDSGYTKQGDRLISLDGSFFTANDVTQVFINYVDYLNGGK